jgi:dienelactone hydrolase
MLFVNTTGNEGRAHGFCVIKLLQVYPQPSHDTGSRYTSDAAMDAWQGSLLWFEENL